MTRRVLILLIAVRFLLPAPSARAAEIIEDAARPWIEKAEQYIDEGRLSAAVESLKDALRIDPASREARLLLGRTHLIDRRPAAALAVLKDAAFAGEDQAALAVYRGFALMELDEKDSARAAYRESVTGDSAGAVRTFLICLRSTSGLNGNRRDRKGANAAAERLLRHIDGFKSALDLEWDDIPLPADSCAAQFADGRYERREHLGKLFKIEKSLRAFSGSGDNTLMRDDRHSLGMKRALMLMDLGLNREAIDILDRDLPAHAPASEFVLFRRIYQAVAHNELGEHGKAIRILREVVRLNGEFPWAQYYLGRALEADGSYAGAIRAYERAEALSYEVLDTAFRLGNCYAESDRYEEAMSAYLRAILEEDENPEVHNNLGVLLFRRGINREAIDNFDKAIALNPRYTDAWYNLGRGYEAIGRQAEAIDAYRKVLDLDRDHAEAWNNIGSLLNGMGRSAEAVDCFQQALRRDPGLEEAHYNLGVSLKSEKRYAEAAEHFAHLTERGSEDAATWRELGICREKQGLLDEAVVVLEKSTALDNNDFNAWYFLARTYRALGRKEDAKRAFNRMKALNPALADALE